MSNKGLMGFRTLLLGGPGSGKSFAIRTLVEAGMTPMVIMTEPCEVHGDVPEDKLHWKYISPMKTGLKEFEDQIKKVSSMTHQQLCDANDMNRHTDNRMLELTKTLNEFECDRTGEKFGAVDTWGTDKVLVIDSLSGLVMMALSVVVGNRVALNIADYGKWQGLVERATNEMVLKLKCPIVMTGHLELETDEMTMQKKVMASLPGKKLAQTFGRYFSDVVLAKRVGKEFFWSTIEGNMDLKARNLPFDDKLKPSFVQIVEKWKERGGVIGD